MKLIMGLLAGLAGCQAAQGAISNAELQDAMGNVPGVTWSVVNPTGNAWSRTYDNYNLRPAGYRMIVRRTSGEGYSYYLSGHVQGPGILELDRAASLNFPTTVMIDGVVDGGIAPNRDHTDRVYVPPGTHEVTWMMTVGDASSYAETTFGRGRWQPGLVLPLAAGEADGSVVLGGAGWQGLSGWPDGSGNATWSGLMHAVPNAGASVPKILRGDTEGAGVVRFRYLARGKEARVRTDGGTWAALPYKDSWSTGFIPVRGAGPHSIEWEASGPVDARRVPADVAVRDVRRVAEVDFATALDAPHLTFTETPNNTSRPFGAEMEGTRGGSGVVVGYRRGVDFVLAERSLVKIRETGGGRFFGGGALSNPWALALQSDVLSSETLPDGEWTTRCYLLSPGTYTLGAMSEARVDYIEIVPHVTSLADALGLPEGGFTVGGDAPWTIEPRSDSGNYEAYLSLTGAADEGWIEHQVTGPAEVSFNYRGYSNSTAPLQVLVDGKACWDSGLSHLTNKAATALIEVPAGTHTIRYLAKRSAPYFGDVSARVSAIRVVPLPEGGVIGESVGAAVISGRNGIWSGVTGLGGDPAEALVPASKWDYYGEKPRLRIPFTGPGTVRFRSHFPVSTASSNAGIGAQLSFSSSSRASVVRSGSDGHGWKNHSLWLPPGNHHLTMEARGVLEDTSRMALSALEFQADPVMPAMDVLGIEGVSPTFSPADQPWVGTLRTGASKPVLVSPAALSTTPRKMQITLTAPGEFSFEWEKLVAGTPTGTFRVNGQTIATAPDSVQLRRKVTTFINQDGPVTLEWEISTYWDYGGWLELGDFSWKPWPEKPLAASLDAGDLTWSTSVEHPVTGRDTPGAVGGTAANVRLPDGKSTWLETTFEGAGLLDFSVLASTATGGMDPWNSGIGIRVLVDGKVIQQPWRKVEPMLVMGDGTHTIRIEFSAYWGGGSTPKALAVDNVRWVPQGAISPGEGWSSSVPEALAVFPSLGENGADGIILLTKSGEDRWIEREVTGPGRLSWRENRTLGEGTLTTWSRKVDGLDVGVLVYDYPDIWMSSSMDIPAGTHRVRFSLETEITGDDPDTVELPIWIISGMTFTPGVSPLMEGLDQQDALWFSTGMDAGTHVSAADSHDQEDKWSPGRESVLYLLNPGTDWMQASSDINGGPGKPPLRRSRFIAPRSAIFWNDAIDGNDVVLVDRFRSQPLGETPLEEALDLPRTVEPAGWRGFSFLGDDRQDFPEDAAVSPAPADDRSGMSTVVDGPAKVRFRWRCDAMTKLIAGIDGREAPLAPAGAEWAAVELDVPPGRHVISWHHLSLGNFSFDPSVALVDALEIEAVPAKTPGEIVTLAGIPALPVEAGAGWSVGYRNIPDGPTESLGTNTSDGALKLDVEGPRILSFRPWLSQRRPLISGQIPTVPDWAGNIMEYVLEVKMDGELLREFPIYFSSLSEILLPAGHHEISWRLVAKLYDPVTQETTAVPVWQDFDYDVGITDLQTTSPADHFRNWKDNHGLTGENSGPNDDADGDGLTNFMEYAYGMDPQDRYSGTWGLWTWLSPDDILGTGTPPGQLHFYVSAEYTLPHVESVLEESSDLKTWRKVSDTTSPKTRSWMFSEIFSYPVTPEHPARFFRVRMVVPETP
ncbi:hypothetical protein OVA24_17825 [Luteolibacter sp. SL250]|uniref:hypothetical protein n=1 Tax=Luteolibacter sp. SL250 TaxID=2995170 RepID=UPI0022711BA7|nr:hypothetical protein [Luteolibacter sp. SL250]WAC19088.1 hypothetical protein OVA24_17825 [Luteolibacter sp. SL250]